jgi:hypothetical protein
MGFLIKKAAQQIVTAKVSLTPTDLSTAGFIYDIPEYPAIPGYFWNTLFMNGEIIADIGSTPYIGNTNIHIQASMAPNYQLRFGPAFMSQPADTWHTTVVTSILAQVYQRNDKLQIHNVNALTVGDTSLNIYVGAILQQY